jgi:hypothetical protein
LAGYERVIDLQGQLRTAILTLATGAPLRIGFDRPRHSVPDRRPCVEHGDGASFVTVAFLLSTVNGG